MTPLAVQFTDTSTNNPTAWTWNFGDGSTSSSQNPSHIYTNTDCNFAPLTQSYTVKIAACNGEVFACDKTINPTVCNVNAPDGYWGNCGVKTSSIVVSNPPSPSVPITAFTVTRESGPAPLAVQFTDTSTNNPTAWTWNFGDGSTSSSQNPSHIYSISGVYYVTMQASIQCFQGNFVRKTITVGSPILPITSTSTTTTTAPTTVTTPSPTSTTTITRITTVPTTGQTTSITTVPTKSQTTITIVTPKPTETVNYSATIAAMQSQIAEQNAKITEQGNILNQIMTFLRNLIGWK
jgi:PKD repeat protein